VRELLGSEVELFVVLVDDVRLVAVSGWDFVSSLNALPPPSEAAPAGGAKKAARTSASATQPRPDLARAWHVLPARLDTWRAYRLSRRRLRASAPSGAASGAPRRQYIEWPPMAPKQRQIRIEQRGALEAIQALESRSDEELQAETKYKSAALAILGARASERFDAEAARSYFQRAIAAARPQERMQLRRMADASLALAERRAGDLKEAVERLGQTPPSGRQMFALRAMGLLVPPRSAGILARLRGILLILALVAVLLAIGLGLVELISLPFGGLGLAPALLLGLFAVIAVLGVAAAVGRRRRDRARAAASS
jgi:hypothetical protein